MARKPKMAEESTPMMMLESIPECKSVGNFKIAAPRIIGVDNRKENLAALILFKPLYNPALMLIPDLEKPGITANAWDKPITTESLKLTCSIFFLPLNVLSAQYKIAPAIIKVMAINKGERKMVSAFFSNSRPKITPGMVAMIKK